MSNRAANMMVRGVDRIKDDSQNNNIKMKNEKNVRKLSDLDSM